jgi:hypothetical protein
MKKPIKLCAIFTILISCAAQVNISNSLKEAWIVVNRDQDIYARHLVLSEEIAKIDKSLSENLDSEEVSQLIRQKNETLSKLIQEQQKVLKIQSTVEEASDKEILYLASL